MLAPRHRIRRYVLAHHAELELGARSGEPRRRPLLDRARRHLLRCRCDAHEGYQSRSHQRSASGRFARVPKPLRPSMSAEAHNQETTEPDNTNVGLIATVTVVGAL